MQLVAQHVEPNVAPCEGTLTEVGQTPHITRVSLTPLFRTRVDATRLLIVQ